MASHSSITKLFTYIALISSTEIYAANTNCCRQIHVGGENVHEKHQGSFDRAEQLINNRGTCGFELKILSKKAIKV